MAMGNFARCLAHTLRHEGGYVDHPSDPGGATNLGITRATLADWRGRAVSKDDVRALTRAEASDIYRRRYWDAVSGDQLPAGVDLAVFDYAVNSGPRRAALALQARLGVARDGVVGPQTIAASRQADAAVLIRAICGERRGFLGRLRIFTVFGRGWLRRIAAVERAAIQMARQAAQTASQPKEQERMDMSKSILQSRTVWSNIVGILAIAASVLGFNAGLIDQGALVDAILKGFAGASFVASTLFRVIATKRIG
jgi:lysozyme family protein